MRLEALRAQLRLKSVHAVIVPTEDAHQSEYAPSCFARRAFVSGFTGSAGTAVVTLDKVAPTLMQAVLLTDGRYYLQARNQLLSGWEMLKAETSDPASWLAETLPANASVAIDPALFTIAAVRALRDSLKAHGHSLVTTLPNLVDIVWPQRPHFPVDKIKVHELKYAGATFTSKLLAIKTQLQTRKCSNLVVTALDEIAWLFNLRGTDVSFNPVFVAYAYISMTETVLFIDECKLTQQVRDHLAIENVVFKPYSEIFPFLTTVGQQSHGSPTERLYLDTRCSYALLEAYGLDNPVCVDYPLVQHAKAIKNNVELEGFRKGHQRDAVALCRYFSWLENELVCNGNMAISEYDGGYLYFEYRLIIH